MITCTALRWGAPGQPLTPAVDFTLETGSLTGVIGPNGCGKSSLLKVIAGLQKPLAGKIRVDVPRRGGVSFLPQQQHLDRQFPISLQELVAAGFWGTRLTPQQRSERLHAVLEDWCLSGLEQRPLMALSGGELQRALLARLSLTDAQVLLLDEPEAALDEQGLALLWQHIQRWQVQGRTQVIVSHSVSSMSQHLDNALLVSRSGCIAAPIRELIGQRSSLEQVA